MRNLRFDHGWQRLQNGFCFHHEPVAGRDAFEQLDKQNLAAVVALLPILFEVARGLQLDPLLLCVPAVIAASCGFMLPVATPPNAIVFGTGHIKLGQMVRTGFALDLLAVVLIPLFTYLFGGAVLGIKM